MGNPSRFRSYIKHNERKALKYLLRCHFKYICEGNKDMISYQQFKFALYHRCNIRSELNREILPVLKFHQNDSKRRHYVVTEHSFIHWMLKHFDQMINLRATQSFKDKKLKKILSVIGYTQSHKIKKKKNNNNKERKRHRQNKSHHAINPFVAISPKTPRNRGGMNQMMKAQSTNEYGLMMDAHNDFSNHQQQQYRLRRPLPHTSQHRRSISQGDISNALYRWK